MLKTSEVLQAIKEYNAAIYKAAFPMNIRVNFFDNNKAIEFLTDLVKTAKGDDIEVNDYAKLQQYSQAMNLLKFPATLPEWEKVEKIEKWHRKTFKFREGEKISIVMFEDIKKTLEKWRLNERYLTVPDDFRRKHYYDNKYFYDRLKTLPPEKQAAAAKSIEMISNPDDLFAKAKVAANNGLVALVKLIEDKHEDKGERFIDHVYLDMRHDVDPRTKEGREMFGGYFNIDYWLRYGVDARFRIDQKTFESTVDNLFKQLQQGQKLQAAEKKAAEEEEAKKQKEKTKKDVAAFANESEAKAEAEQREKIKQETTTYFSDRERQASEAQAAAQRLAAMPITDPNSLNATEEALREVNQFKSAEDKLLNSVNAELELMTKQ